MDNEGITKPLERGNLHVTVKGGTLEALGNACPYNEKGYLGTETETYYGEALAIVRAGNEAELEIGAEDGIHQAELKIPVTEKPNAEWR